MAQMYVCEEKKLEDLCAAIFEKNGFPPASARAIAEQLVVADMRGMRSHGVVRVDMYLTQAEKGAIVPDAVPEVVSETPTTAVIDAHRAAGAVASELGARIAREKALEYGLGMVTVRNSNHHGTCGYWGMKIAQDDMIAFVTTNTPPLLAAPCSKVPVIGNNPISLVVPAEGKSMCLDISNGVMAFGKIHEHRRLNKPFPENAWLDENGQPTTDPFANEFLKFISLPVGMHKGFGLAVMAEMVSSILAGGAFAQHIVPEGSNTDENNDTAHCFVAIRIDAFRDPAAYRADVEDYIQFLHSAETRKEGDRIFYPGEIENIAWEKSVREGVSIPGTTRDFLCAKAKEAGLMEAESVFIPKEEE